MPIWIQRRVKRDSGTEEKRGRWVDCRQRQSYPAQPNSCQESSTGRPNLAAIATHVSVGCSKAPQTRSGLRRERKRPALIESARFLRSEERRVGKEGTPRWGANN